MMTESDPDKSKIVVDDDWKTQARADKEKLAAEQARQGADGGQEPQGGAQHFPPADFTTLVAMTATQAQFALGLMPDPQTGRRHVNLDMAKFQIDTLKVLEDKTAGNLDERERTLLDSTLYELRTQYVAVVQQGRQV